MLKTLPSIYKLILRGGNFLPKMVKNGQNCVFNESNDKCQSGCFENYDSNKKGIGIKNKKINK
jgi:hypothetical protein